MRTRLFFYLLVAAVAAVLVTFRLDHIPDHLLLAGPVSWYAASAIFDIARTSRAGRGVVAARETAAPFRMVARRMGLPAAILVQVAMETAAAAIATPVILGHHPLHLPSVSLFCTVAAVSHTYGYLCNRRHSIPRTSPRQNF